MDNQPTQSNTDRHADKILPDTSVIIEGILSAQLALGELHPVEIIISEAVLAELEHQANIGKSIGFIGLDEIKRIRFHAQSKGITVSMHGVRPKPQDIVHAHRGEIDALIRQLAYELGATLLTSDKVQKEVALAKGMSVWYVQPPKTTQKKLKLEGFFDSVTMSVHLRENVMPFAKKGKPGDWEFVALREAVLSQEEIQDISREIIEEAKLRKDGFIEIERVGSTIVQLGVYRIVITRPPFSDGWEITAVRPVKKLELRDYNLSEKLMQRLGAHAEGILIAGAPGMGKSTFAQGLAEFYASQKKIVKTVEAPRDLILPETITQYALSHGDAQEVHDILLLSRPDYTIFDEMRNTKDFELFADLRLAGVGMVGVVHGTSPVDAIQRFLGRVEMGVIPQIVDTVVFISKGMIGKVLSVKMTVKVPSGMTEADLARPVVEIHDFEGGKLEYEIYSYGEQTVVIPVSLQASSQQSGALKLAAGRIVDEFRNYSDFPRVEVVSPNKCIVYVPEQDIAHIIGKQGATITKIEEKLGLSIEVREETQKIHPASSDGLREIPYDLHQKKKHLVFSISGGAQNKDVSIFIGDDLLVTAKTGNSGILKIKADNPIGKQIVRAQKAGQKIKVMG